MNYGSSWALIEPDGIRSYRDLIDGHLGHLSKAIGLAEDAASRQLAIVSGLLGAWAEEPVEAFAGRSSFAGNDGSPVEFSFSLAASAAAARVLFEPEPSQASPGQSGGDIFAERLAGVSGVEIRRLRQIRETFGGPPSGQPFRMLYSAVIDGRADFPAFKVYLNPMVGERPSEEVVGAALGQLGLGAQWRGLLSHLRAGSARYDPAAFAFFALDLDDSPTARVKVYLRQAGYSGAEIEHAAGIAADHRPGWFPDILRRHYGPDLADLGKAPVTCFTFRAGQEVPVSATLHCPLEPNLPHDAASAAVVSATLRDLGIDPGAFQAAVDVICGADPAVTNRLSWASYKRPDEPVVTVYAGLDGTKPVRE